MVQMAKMVNFMLCIFFFYKKKKRQGERIILDAYLTQKPSLNVLGMTYYIFSD